MVRLAIMLILTQAVAIAETLPDPAETDSYTVIYTGRTMGYFRIPEYQCTLTDNCPKTHSPKAADQFDLQLTDAQTNSKGTQIRVATGDNFAPYLLARELWYTPENSKKSKLVVKELAPDFD